MPLTLGDPSMTPMGFLAYYILFVAFVCFVWWMFLRANAERVRRWAVDNGFAIIDLR